MKRSLGIVVGAVVVVVVVVLALLTTGVVSTPLADSTPSPEPDPSAAFPDGSLLPQERTIVAKARSDGHLAVTETIVFDAADGSSTALGWRIGGSRIGWLTNDRDQQYGVIPTIVNLTAQETAPKTRAKSDLPVTQDQTPFDDPYTDTHVYRTMPAGGWTRGQHSVTLTYELADVFLAAGGVSVVVLPLSFFEHPDSWRQSANVTRVTMIGAPRVRCLADNVDFVDQQVCDDSTATLRYRGDTYDNSVSAVAYVDPGGVTAQPAAAPVRKRR